MAPGLSRAARTRFNSSRLIRLLAEFATADVDDSTQSFTERLGGWLDWPDAIALSAALSSPAAPHPGAGGPAGHAADALQRARGELAQAVRSDPVLAPGKPRPASSARFAAAAAPAPGALPDFAAYRSRYQAHQRAMAARIGPLRAQLRMAAAAVSPALGELAALDAVLDKALAAREQQLLGTVPALLEQHFKRLQRAQPAVTADKPAVTPANTPANTPAAAPAWLAAWRQTLQAVLLAELDIRLQPLDGLLDAITNHEVARHP